MTTTNRRHSPKCLWKPLNFCVSHNVAGTWVCDKNCAFGDMHDHTPPPPPAREATLNFAVRNRKSGRDWRVSAERIVAALEATEGVPLEALKRGNMVAPSSDDCTYHILTCPGCSRQWTVHMVNSDETTQCYFVGLCFDCLNARGLNMWRAAELLERALKE